MFTSRPWKILGNTFPRRNNKITILQRPYKSNILISLNNSRETFVRLFFIRIKFSHFNIFSSFFSEKKNSHIAKMGELQKQLLFIFIGLFHTLFSGVVLTERTTIGSAFPLYAKIYNAYTL